MRLYEKELIMSTLGTIATVYPLNTKLHFISCEIYTLIVKTPKVISHYGIGSKFRI